MTVIALLTLVCMITYSFEIVFGLAGTIMMLAAMSFLVETKTLVIYSVLPQIMVAMIGLARSPRTVEWRFLAGMLVFAVAGGIGGFTLFQIITPGLFQWLLATVITLFGLYLVAAPGRLCLSWPMARLLDLSAGASQALFGISGPIAMTRLLSSFEQKVVVRNYALAFFLCLNLFRAGGYIANDIFTAEIGLMMAVSAPFLLVTLWFANDLHFKINELWFRRVVAWMILGGGVTLFFH